MAKSLINQIKAVQTTGNVMYIVGNGNMVVELSGVFGVWDNLTDAKNQRKSLEASNFGDLAIYIVEKNKSYTLADIEGGEIKTL